MEWYFISASIAKSDTVILLLENNCRTLFTTYCSISAKCVQNINILSTACSFYIGWVDSYFDNDHGVSMLTCCKGWQNLYLTWKGWLGVCFSLPPTRRQAIIWTIDSLLWYIWITRTHWVQVPGSHFMALPIVESYCIKFDIYIYAICNIYKLWFSTLTHVYPHLLITEITETATDSRTRLNNIRTIVFSYLPLPAQIAKFMGPTWGPPGSCRPQMCPMWAQWTLLLEILQGSA